MEIITIYVERNNTVASIMNLLQEYRLGFYLIGLKFVGRIIQLILFIQKENLIIFIVI